MPRPLDLRHSAREALEDARHMSTAAEEERKKGKWRITPTEGLHGGEGRSCAKGQNSPCLSSALWMGWVGRMRHSDAGSYPLLPVSWSLKLPLGTPHGLGLATKRQPGLLRRSPREALSCCCFLRPLMENSLSQETQHFGMDPLTAMLRKMTLHSPGTLNREEEEETLGSFFRPLVPKEKKRRREEEGKQRKGKDPWLQASWDHFAYSGYSRAFASALDRREKQKLRCCGGCAELRSLTGPSAVLVPPPLGSSLPRGNNEFKPMEESDLTVSQSV